MRSYYTIFDKDNDRLGFVPSYVVPTASTLDRDYIIVVATLSPIGGIALIGVIIYYFYQSKLSKVIPKNDTKIDFNDEVVVVRYKKQQ